MHIYIVLCQGHRVYMVFSFNRYGRETCRVVIPLYSPNSYVYEYARIFDVEDIEIFEVEKQFWLIVKEKIRDFTYKYRF